MGGYKVPASVIVGIISIVLLLIGDRILIEKRISNLETQIIDSQADIKDMVEAISRMDKVQIINTEKIRVLEEERNK